MLGWKLMGAGIQGLAVTAIGADTAASLSAAGTTQGTATELTATDNEIATVAANAGVVLASKLAPGDEQTVYNAGANPLKIYMPIKYPNSKILSPVIFDNNMNKSWTRDYRFTCLWPLRSCF